MGEISNVINGIGGPSNIGNADIPVTVTDYPAVPDTTAPTVAITDNVAAATATGDVTFTFTFSEGVGTSFTADDVVIAGGTAGAFVRVDASHATLVVAPPANSTGTISVSVAAGTFSDAAGNTNTTSAAAQQAYDTVASPPPPPSGSVITFDETTPPTLTSFGGADSTIVADPTNAANKVAQVVKGVGAALWAGTTVSTLPNTAVPTIAFSATNTMLKARVWSPDAGIPVRLKVENAADPTQSVETEATTLVAGGWETLAFDFAKQAPGTAALNLAFTYNKVSIFFNFGTDGTGKTYYLDDLDLAPTGDGTPPPPPATNWQISFDDAAVQYMLTDFGLYGAAGAVVPDPAGGTNSVAKMVKTTGSEQWGGTTVSTGVNQSVPTIPFTQTSTKMTMRVYSPAAGIRVRMKVENAGNPGINCETDAFTTTSGAWETLTFDFGDPSTHYIPNGPTSYDLTKPTASLNVANTYNKVSVFFDFGLGNGGYAPMVADRTYYLDDLAFVS
ncbi:Ig-like domain-containing protein [Cryobacterium sp. PH31-AA6]|nr:Ig-like domain-containing protein [Cryobacterium sp. PH31-AA6]MDJ0322919.1 Ig-like domain-containing protein [Cryobacterium sp. PH31-AA6]